MKIELEIGANGQTGRRAEVIIKPQELATVHLKLAYPEQRNRTGLYLRRHPAYLGEINPKNGSKLGPNNPLKAQGEPPKLPVTVHLQAMCKTGLLPVWKGPENLNGETFRQEPYMLAVPISDTVANLLRPCFHRDGLHTYDDLQPIAGLAAQLRRIFFLEGEPIDRKTYWCLCFFASQVPDEPSRLEFRRLHFDVPQDLAFDAESGDNLMDQGLVWAAALVPLVEDSKPLAAAQIAQHDYDLRQVVGRGEDEAIEHVYEGWFDRWDERVGQLVSEHEAHKRPFATFYHSILALDQNNQIIILQTEGTLPDLAKELAAQGMRAAGLLDSGGSCALYDVWLGSYLNHFWYFREPRGGILIFQLQTRQRLPKDDQSWLQRRLDSISKGEKS